MKLRPEIYQMIINDLELRKKIAVQLEVLDNTVYYSAQRKSAKLRDYQVIKIIMEHTGLSESEIFETETEIAK